MRFLRLSASLFTESILAVAGRSFESGYEIFKVATLKFIPVCYSLVRLR